MSKRPAEPRITLADVMSLPVCQQHVSHFLPNHQVEELSLQIPSLFSNCVRFLGPNVVLDTSRYVFKKCKTKARKLQAESRLIYLLQVQIVPLETVATYVETLNLISSRVPGYTMASVKGIILKDLMDYRNNATGARLLAPPSVAITPTFDLRKLTPNLETITFKMNPTTYSAIFDMLPPTIKSLHVRYGGTVGHSEMSTRLISYLCGNRNVSQLTLMSTYARVINDLFDSLILEGIVFESITELRVGVDLGSVCRLDLSVVFPHCSITVV